MSQYVGTNAMLPHGPTSGPSEKWDLASSVFNSAAKDIEVSGGFVPYVAYNNDASAAASAIGYRSLNGNGNAAVSPNYQVPASPNYSQQTQNSSHPQWQGIRLPTTPHMSSGGGGASVQNSCGWSRPPTPLSAGAMNPPGSAALVSNQQMDRHGHSNNNGDLRRPTNLHQQGAIVLGGGGSQYGAGSMQSLDSASLSGGNGAFSVLSNPLLSPTSNQQWISASGAQKHHQLSPHNLGPRSSPFAATAMGRGDNSLSPCGDSRMYLSNLPQTGSLAGASDEYLTSNAVRLLQEQSLLPQSLELDMLRSLTSSLSQVNNTSGFSGSSSSTGNKLPHQFSASASPHLSGPSASASTSTLLAQQCSSLSPNGNSISVKLLNQLEQQMHKEQKAAQLQQQNGSSLLWNKEPRPCPVNGTSSSGFYDSSGRPSSVATIKQEIPSHTMDETALEAAKAILSFQQQNISQGSTIAFNNNSSSKNSSLSSGSTHSDSNIQCQDSVDDSSNYQPISPASGPHSPSAEAANEQCSSNEDVKTENGEASFEERERTLSNGDCEDDEDSTKVNECATEIEKQQLDDDHFDNSGHTVPMDEDRQAMTDHPEQSSAQQEQEENVCNVNGSNHDPIDESRGPSLTPTPPLSMEMTKKFLRMAGVMNGCSQAANGTSASDPCDQNDTAMTSCPHNVSIPLAIQAVTDGEMFQAAAASVLQAIARSTPASSTNSSSMSPQSSSTTNCHQFATTSSSSSGAPVLSGIPPNVHTCPVCGFTSTSKFHFNSHMNTHTDHKCDYCDYTSRTEGRLKRHMKESHSNPPSTPGDIGLGNSFSDNELLQPDVSSDADMSRDSVTPGSQGKERNPSMPSKPKIYRCKQCAFIAQNKNEFWNHARSHIKGDKLLICPKCPFVTEYKHHLEYHLRNHYGSKPFQCKKCNYSCVNKSMLNSHMKSHSNYYQYRCADCTYATKYCHSLKLHLRKYGHNPATVVNPDGTMVEAETIDIYGNRRGPRPKKPSTPPLSGISSFLQSTLAGGTSSDQSSESGMPTTPLVPFMEALQSTLMASSNSNGHATKDSLSSAISANYAMSLADTNSGGGPFSSMAHHNSGGGSLQSPIANRPSNFIGSGAGSQVFKCSLCDYASNTREVLTQHVIVHIAENQKLCRDYGISHANISSFAAQLTAAVCATQVANESVDGTRQGNNGYASSAISLANPVALNGVTGHFHQYQQAKDAAASLRVRGGLLHGLRNNQEHHSSSLESSPNGSGRYSPSRDISQSSNSPVSASGERKSEDEGMACNNGLDGVGNVPILNRRKGKAYKLDKIALKLQGKLSPSTSPASSVGDSSGAARPNNGHSQIDDGAMMNDEPTMRYHGSPYAAQQQQTRLQQRQESSSDALTTNNLGSRCLQRPLKPPEAAVAPESGFDWGSAYICHHCDIAFKDGIMYTMHMGYHGYEDPFKCNMCGHISHDRLSMFLHIARAPHR